MAYSKSIQNLINSFRKLPSVGHRTAERFVFYLLKSGKKEVAEITLALKELIDNVKSCESCWDFADANPCTICSNKMRDQTLLCIVSEPQDIPIIEKTRAFNGLYHVLRGAVEADANDLEKLKIKELFTKLEKTSTLTEVILALNPDLAGETTMLFLEKRISELNKSITITRLARGLPMGSDLQYADEITLGSAIKNRTVK
jgi:recombination protein RecR